MNPKTPMQVQQQVDELKRIKNPVAFHAAEDNLYRAILQSIASGFGEDWQNMAKEALKSQKITTERGYRV